MGGYKINKKDTYKISIFVYDIKDQMDTSHAICWCLLKLNRKFSTKINLS